MNLIKVYAGGLGSGKTTAALGDASPRAVLFAPDARNANPQVRSLKWVPVDLLQPRHLPELRKKYKRFRVIFPPGTASRISDFTGEGWAGYTFIFDDFPKMFIDRAELRAFSAWCVDVRHRGCQVIITSQSIPGVLPPLVRNVLADTLVQVGPVYSREEAWHLFNLGGGAKHPNFKSFYQAISTNPKFHKFIVKIS